MNNVANANLATPAQVARACNVTPPTVKSWLKAGIISAEIQVGRIYRFDLDRVKAELKQASEGKAVSP